LSISFRYCLQLKKKKETFIRIILFILELITKHTNKKKNFFLTIILKSIFVLKSSLFHKAKLNYIFKYKKIKKEVCITTFYFNWINKIILKYIYIKKNVYKDIYLMTKQR